MPLVSALYGTAIYGTSFYGRIFQGINSNSIINTRTTLTINSSSNIVLPKGADLFDCAYSETLNEWEFSKKVTYRRYQFTEDNMTGDLDKSDYTDYDIYAEVQTLGTYRDMSKTGEVEIGDVVLYTHREIKYDRDGNIIDNPFRPQLHDEFEEDGFWYRIDKIYPYYVGESELAFECFSKRIDNENDPDYS